MLQNKKLFFTKFFFILVITFYTIYINNNKYTLECDIQVMQTNTSLYGQFYYANNNPYTDQQVKNFHYGKLKKINHYMITFDSKKISQLRFDPLPDKGIVLLKNCIISNKYGHYSFNFENLQTLKSHNIHIEKHNNNYILLKSIGKDPYIELNHSIKIPHEKLKKFIYFLLISLLLFLLLEVCIFVLQKNIQIQTMLLSSILIIYTFFTFFGSYWDVAETLLIVFSSISILFYFSNSKKYTPYIKSISIFLIIYLTLSYLSIYISYGLGNLQYLNEKSLYIIAVALIPLPFYKISSFNATYFKIFLTVLLLIFSLLICIENAHLIHFEKFFRMNVWVEKAFDFWYILLLFGNLSFYSLKNKKDFSIILLLMLVSYYTIYNSYSKSALVALSLGICIFIFFSFISIKKQHINKAIWIFVLYIIFSPILFSLVDLSSYHPRLVSRNQIYHTAASLIQAHPLFGYGFGSTLTIHLKDIVESSKIPLYYINTFPGGHPHNLSLLFWLEFGIFGAIFLAYYIHKLLYLIVQKTYATNTLPALLALFVEFEILTSFSWSIWYPQVLLTFAFFAVMLTLSMNKIGKE